MVKYVVMKGSCRLKVGPCQLSLQRLNHDYKMLTFNTTFKGVQVETKKKKALCALGVMGWFGAGGNRPSDCQMFSGKDFYEYKFLHLLIPRETLIS